MPKKRSRKPAEQQIEVDPIEYLTGGINILQAATSFVIIQDTREQEPYLFLDKYNNPQVLVAGLGTGDYSVLGFEDRIALERKSLDDFVGSISNGRERFEREVQRGQDLDYFAVIIKGSMEDVRRHQYRSLMLPHAVLQTAISWELRYGCRFIWAGSRPAGEYVVYNTLRKYHAARRFAG